MNLLRASVAASLALASVGGALGLVPSPASAATGESVTAIASAAPGFADGDGAVGAVRLAAAGRFVAFSSSSTNLVPGTTGSYDRVYVRDLLTDQTVLVSHDGAGASAPAASAVGSISSDGRFVVFSSLSPLSSADTNGFADVYVWDRTTDEVELASQTWNEAVGNGDSGMGVSVDDHTDVSDDGRYVFFASAATNMSTVVDNGGRVDLFRRDRVNGTTSLITVDGSLQANGNSYSVNASSDGRYVVFATNATNFPGTDTNGSGDVWLRDFNDLNLSKVSIGLDADANASSGDPQVSDNGNLISFSSTSTDLVANDTNGVRDTFLRNRSAGTTVRTSVANGTSAQLAGGGTGPVLSRNGARVAFTTLTQAGPGDANQLRDTYVRSGTTTTRASLGTAAREGQQAAYADAISDDQVAWTSTGDFTTTDTNSDTDAFVTTTPFIGAYSSFDTFVPSQVTAFTGVTPTVPDAAPTIKLLRAGASPEHWVMTLADDPAFAAKKAPVIRLYWAYFKRRPDLGGLTYWMNKYRNGAKLVDISQQFAKSNEFKTKYGSTTPTQFVTLVYQNVLERQPESGGLAYWANKIANGTPRGQVMTNFSESSEGRRVIGPRSDAILVAYGMFKKIPSQVLFDAVVADQQDGYPREIIVDYYLGAPEFQTP